jgi:hypothetical protein
VSDNGRGIMQSELVGKLMVGMAARSSRNRSPLDKLCRAAVSRLSAPPSDDDFMRDPLIDNDLGFDPDELDRYQRGESN